MSHVGLSEETKLWLKLNFLPPIEDLFTNKIITSSKAHKLYGFDSNAVKNDHRNRILKRGRPDFESTSDGVTGNQKVDLYCYYYFQMHCSSSFQFYLNERKILINSIDKDTYFIDIGCGPFTSGNAFNSWMKNNIDLTQLNIKYVGVDISDNMLSKANAIIKSKELSYSSTHLFNNKEDVLELLAKDDNDKVIILNYSYLFASESLVVQEFVDFTLKLHELNDHILIFQQNPLGASLNSKWVSYKSKLKSFKLHTDYPSQLSFTFEDLLESCTVKNPNFTVYCDVLKSF